MHAVNVFVSMLTQWRVAGMDGVRVGLDYGVLPEMWRRCKVPPAERDQVFQDLRLMEDTALGIFADRREKQSRKSR